MKKLCFALLSVAMCAFADIPELQPIAIEERVEPKSAFFYVQFAAGEHDVTQASAPVPGVGVGYRRLTASGAADLSFSGIGIAERKNARFIWTAPKVSYYHYLQPNADKSFYAGGGMAWGGVDTKKDHFIGIIPSATLGYEFVRQSSILGFSELTICQPALPVWQKGKFPGPVVQLSAGMGF